MLRDVLKGALRDTYDVYRLLFGRSVRVAAPVYAVVAIVDAASQRGAAGLALLSFLLDFAGPILVQGALVEIVRNLHEGRPPAETGQLAARVRERIMTLVGATILYGLAVGFGVLLLVVPGLLVLARWCLLAPLIMLEGRPARSARIRSAELVRPHTGAVLGRLLLVFLGFAVPIGAFEFAIGPATPLAITASFLWSCLTAPFEAHLLSVLYYRLSDPGRPVIHPVLRERG